MQYPFVCSYSALWTQCYVRVPAAGEVTLSPLHCQIVPLEHCSNTRSLDDSAFEEIEVCSCTTSWTQLVVALLDILILNCCIIQRYTCTFKKTIKK